MNLIQKTFSLLDRKQKLQTCGLVFLMIIGAVFEAIGVGMILPFVALVQDPTIAVENQYFRWLSSSFDLTLQGLILFSGAALLLIYVAKNSFLACMYAVQFRFVYNLEVLISEKLLRHYLFKPYTFHLQKNSAELLKNVTIEVLQAFNQVMLPLLIILSECAVVAVLLSFLMAVDPAISLASLGFLGGLAFLFFRAVRKRINNLGSDHQYYYEQIFKWINQGLGGVKEAKILNRENFFIDAFRQNMVQLSKAQRYPQVVGQLPRLFIEMLIITAMLLVVMITHYRGESLQALTPTIALFAMAAFRLMPSINRILSMTSLIRYYKPSLDVVHRDLSSFDEHIVQTRAFKESSSTRLPFKHFIELRNVSFRYPESSEPVLRNISILISKGESVAFVGPTGAGKTTLIDLVLGLLSPSEGEIVVDGHNIQENLSGWQRNIGYIPQAIYLTDDSIRRNVAFGIPDEDIDDARVWEVLRTAQLESLVSRLPQGLDTSVGERGVRLSGGERQRIGISRALYHDPDVLVMDEATSSLDHETEHEVTTALERLKSLKTILIIAHRLTTVKNCDVIFRMAEGKLVNRVSYRELVEGDLSHPFLSHASVAGV